MPVTDVNTDSEKLTMTLVADFAAPVERVWSALTDPRQLERFWGPPGWPATFTEFDHTVGGRARYYMTSPQGQRSGGAWEFLAIDEPRGFEVLDSFVGDDGQQLPGAVRGAGRAPCAGAAGAGRRLTAGLARGALAGMLVFRVAASSALPPSRAVYA